MNNPTQSIIMPYHRNKQMLKYTTELLEKIIPDDVEIIVIGNNDDENELDITLSSRIIYIKHKKSMLYSKTVNMGVDIAQGEIITLCDQDIFGYSDWYSPLLKKLLSNSNIGSVSSKLLNPTNNRIIDFGIEYSKYRILHPFRGQKNTHPLVQKDYKVTSTTSAILMMRKQLYMDVGGMDLDMPYCCSDCDIGIKISTLGLENWVVASSEAYHRGSSSLKNGKSSSFSHLKQDSHCMFWAKNYDQLVPTIENTVIASIDCLKTYMEIAPLYYFINLSSSNEYEWYATMLSKNAGFSICDIASHPQSSSHYALPIQIYDELPYTFMNIRVPLIYFVDYFPSISDNQIWKRMRHTENDLVFDCNGNLNLFDHVITGLL